jgi:phage baseplate assembly protein W
MYMAEFVLKGMSFPFRISVKGGVTESIADSSTVTKYVESMQQIVSTKQGERFMNFDIYSEVDKLVYNVNDSTIRKSCEYLVKECLNKLETRVTVNDVTIVTEDSTVLAMVNFTVNSTNQKYLAPLEVGALS